MISFRAAYAKTARAIDKSGLEVYADIIILFSSGYLIIKKAFSFSLSGWLSENLFKQELVNFFVVAGAAIIGASIVIKSISLLTKKFPYKAPLPATPDMISACLQTINQEIIKHIKKCESPKKYHLRDLKDEHQFNLNLSLIIACLSEQIMQSISTLKIKKRDLFISLYHYDPSENCLIYELHYDHKKDSVKSKRICLDEKIFERYECVKCMNSSDSTAYVLDTKAYTRGHSKRFKTVKHYMGCKLEANGYNFGFLNIEFHNQNAFSTEEEMQEFMEDSIFPFKQLIEYQYLKREFFGKFENLEAHWETG